MKKERIDNLENKAKELEDKLNNIKNELQRLYTDDIETFLQDSQITEEHVVPVKTSLIIYLYFVFFKQFSILSQKLL